MTLFNKARAAIAASILLAGAAAIAAPPGGGTITVQIGNIRNGHGNVHVDICPEKQFLGDNCLYTGDAPAHSGLTVVTVHNVPAGRYAAQVTHDENNNKKVDRGLFGIPREGIGFSNDARISFGPPKWADAVFAFNGQAQTISLKMRYMMGASGPAAR